MADWNTPTLTSTYTSVIDTLKNRDIDSARMFDPAFVTLTNAPTNAIRWNSATSVFEKFNGTTWAALTGTYNINVSQLGGQLPAYYLAWGNLTGVPTTFAPSAHTHDDRYFTETESDARFGNNLFVSGNTIQLRTPGNTALTTITVPFATNAGTVGGFTVGQNLATTSAVTFGTIAGTGLTVTAAASADTIMSIVKTGSTETRLKTISGALVFSVAPVGTEAERLRVDIASNVTPPATNTGSLGTASARWGSVISAAFSDGTNTLLNSNGTVAQVAAGATITAAALLTGGVERARIDDAGRLIVGHNANIAAPGSVNPRLQVHGIGGSESAVSITRWSNTTTGPFFWFEKSRGITVGTRGVVSLNDELGSLIFAGDDGTNFSNAATIRAMVDGTPGLADMPGRLEFRTSADGSAAPSERMRIDSLGNVGIGAAANASAILDINSTTKGFRGPSMTTTQRDAIVSPVGGLLIYNTTLNTYQVFNGTSWTSVGGGATGAGANAIFWENDQAITASYTITTNKNAMTAGPVTINSGITVTVPSGSVWTVL
jgi:hypothetical protein